MAFGSVTGPGLDGSLGNVAGNLVVIMGVDLGPFRAGLKQAETELKAADARMSAAAAVPIGNKAAGAAFMAGRRLNTSHPGFGMGAGPGVSTIGAAAGQARDISASLEQADRKAKGLFATIGNIRRIVGRIFLPALIFSQITRMVRAFDELRHAAETFQRTLQETSSGPAKELLDTLRQVREMQGFITADQIQELEIRERGRLVELALNRDYQERLVHLHSISGLMEAMSEGKRSVTLLAEAERKYNTELALTRDRTEELVRLSKILRDELEQRERIERRIREQAKRDITHTTIDARRIGPALDLLQRQRAGGNGWAGGR